ncbi:MAG: two-component system histidine kinase [Actinomycetia bacterium]|nr:two-component system histidine kinase [Actinomycetes bacterium]
MASPDLRSRTAVRDAERSVARVHVAGRAGQLIFSALMVASDRRRFSRPRLQWLLLGAATVESAWLATRLLKKSTYRDPVVLWVDTAFAALGLVVCQAGLGDGDGALWMKNLAIGAAHGVSGSDDGVERLAAIGVLGSAAMWCGTRARGRDAHVAGLTLGLNDVINWAGQNVAARFYVSAHRRYAVLAEEAGAITVARAREAAAEAERSRQHGLLHETTVEVLRELAQSSDAEAATSLARREAARLRHALRTEGERRSELDDGLQKACETAEVRGLSVELVTSELLADVDPAGIAALHEAVRVSLLAAYELDDARRAVVRAANDATTVTVTVRHQGGGFDIGAGSDHEERLLALAAVLAGSRGTAEVWSSPGRGVRVTLRVPCSPNAADSAGKRVTDELSHGLPHDRIGFATARDDDVADSDGDVVGWSDHHVVRAAQDQVGQRGVVDDLQAGARGESLESGAQQGSSRYDPGGRSSFHAPRMTPDTRSVVVRSTSFSGETDAERAEEERRAGRTIVSGFLSYRFSGLATGLAAVVAGRSRYRSRGAANALFGAAAIESVWMARRLWRGGGADARAMGVDAAMAIATVAAGRANVAASHRGTFVNWAPWGFAAPAVAGQAMAAPRRSFRAAGAAAAIGAVTSAALSSGPGEFVSNMGAMAGFFAGGHVLAGQIRRGSRRLDQARSKAVDEGVLLAAEHERSRQLRLLHDSALQTLEAVGNKRYADHATMQSRALEEADRLQLELDGRSARAASIGSEVERIVRAHVGRGLHIDLHVDNVREPAAPVAAALRDACNEALTNIVKHAGVTSAIVRLEASQQGVQITVQDAGKGFDPTIDVGFGTTESIKRRLAEVGGRAEMYSEPAGGTKVVLWGPN